MPKSRRAKQQLLAMFPVFYFSCAGGFFLLYSKDRVAQSSHGQAVASWVGACFFAFGAIGLTWMLLRVLNAQRDERRESRELLRERARARRAEIAIHAAARDLERVEMVSVSKSGGAGVTWDSALGHALETLRAAEKESSSSVDLTKSPEMIERRRNAARQRRIARANRLAEERHLSGEAQRTADAPEEANAK